MPRLQYNTASVALIANDPWTRVFMGNKSRIALIFGNPSVGQLFFNYRDTGVIGPVIVRISDTLGNVLSAKDYGPMIQDEVWVRSGLGNGTVTVTEVYKQGR